MFLHFPLLIPRFQLSEPFCGVTKYEKNSYFIALIDVFDYNSVMYFQEISSQLASLPLFESSYLYAEANTPQQVQRQLTDWVQAGKVVQLQRGLYTLATPYQSERPHSYLIANHLVRGSYVSLHTALSHYDLIPEHVAVVTSVTTCRPGKWQNQYGHFAFQHIQAALFFGFEYRQVTQTQWAYMATPEKALLDLIYLTPEADSEGYIRGLRLQNLDQLNIERLTTYVGRADKPKLKRALPHIVQVAEEELTEYVPL
jgi:predicted transcriptional regulator of viral defense system